jgi:hypothetical protein|nr:hypothetical protein [Kofleriaceae bacterium]
MTKCLCLASLVFAVGCVDPPEQETGDTEQAVTGTALQTFPCDGSHGECVFPLGPTANRACMLAGIRGDASADQLPTVVYIDTDGNADYQLVIENVYGGPTILVTTVCVSAVTVGATSLWSSGDPPVRLTGPSSSARCFLSGWGDNNRADSRYADSVKAYQDGAGAWWLGGSSTEMFGEATCFHGAADDGAWSWGQTSGLNTGNLQYNGAGGVACALTELGGVFRANSQSDGVWLDFDSTYNVWTWTFSGAKHAAAECFR